MTLFQDPYEQWTSDNLFFIQPSIQIKFEDEQNLFSLGWKKINDKWVYNLVYASIIGKQNE